MHTHGHTSSDMVHFTKTINQPPQTNYSSDTTGDGTMKADLQRNQRHPCSDPFDGGGGGLASRNRNSAHTASLAQNKMLSMCTNIWELSSPSSHWQSVTCHPLSYFTQISYFVLNPCPPCHINDAPQHERRLSLGSGLFTNKHGGELHPRQAAGAPGQTCMSAALASGQACGENSENK